MADRSVVVRLSANATQYMQAMEAAKRSTMGLAADAEANLKKVGQSMQNAGRTMTMAFTVPLVGAGVASTRMAQNFQNSFSRMVGLAEVPAREVGRLQEAVKGLTSATGQGPAQLAAGLYQAASSGMNAAQALEATGYGARAAALGMGQARDATGLIAAAVNAYGRENITAAQTMDMLTMAIREGRAEPDEMAHALGRVIPIAAAMGIGFDQVAGTVAYLSNIMGDTDITVTSLRDALVKLNNPTVQGRETLLAMGTSVEELRSTIAEGGILGAFDLLREKGFADNTEAVQRLFADVQGQQAAFALLDDASGALAVTLGKTANAQGSFNEAFAVWDQTDAAAVSKAWGEIQVAALEVGEILLPIVADVLGAVADVAGAFSELPEPVQTAIVALAGVVAIAGPLLMATGMMVSGISGVTAALKVLGGTRIAGALAPLVGPTGLIAGVAAAVAAAGWVAYQGIDAIMGGGYGDRYGDIARGSTQHGHDGRTPTPEPYQAERNPALIDMFGDGAPSDSGPDPWDPASPYHQAPTWWAATGTPLSFDEPAPPRLRPPTAPETSSGPPSMGEAPSFDAYYASEEAIQRLVRLKQAAADYAAVTATMDWGAAGFAGAQAGMAKWSSEFFALTNIAMASEEAYDRLSDAVEKNGMTFDVATPKGRENQQALQSLSSTLDTQFVAAYDAAGGSMEAFMASADAIGLQTIARLSEELGISTEAATELAAGMLGLTQEEYIARFNLSGTEEAKVKLGLLQGTIGLLQEDVQREVAMKIATGDFQGALDLVQTNIAETPTEHSTTIKAIDNASQTIRTIRGLIDGVRSKTVTITVRRQGGSAAGNTYDYGGGDVALSMGGVFDRATRATIGEAGLEVALPLTKPDRLAALLSDPRVFTPISAAMGYAGGSSSSSSSAGSVSTTLDTAGIEAAVERGAYRGASVSNKELASAIRAGTRF